MALTASIVGTRDRETNEVRARHVDATDIPPFNRESANHTGSEFARIMTPASGLESFWSMLKRGNQGTHHYFSEKHQQRYVNEFSRRHNTFPADTLDHMAATVVGMIGKRLSYTELVA